MQYFTERAPTHREAIDKIRMKYGSQAVILTHRMFIIFGVFVLFSREGVEVTGYLSHEPPPKKRTTDLEEEKKKILATVKSEQTLAQVLKEVQAIKEKFDAVPQPSRQDEHPTVKRVEELLIRNEFSIPYIREMTERVKGEFSLGMLENEELVLEQVVEWIGERIEIYRKAERSKPFVFVLVGPTGVGKTTTIAKLAAIYGIGTAGNKPMKVRMITIDTYRIAAKEQLTAYGNIMEIPVTCVQSPEELKKTLALYHDVDIIFIDTIGKSPRDYTKLAEMQALLDVCAGTSETHLAMSATTKTSDIYELLRQFEPFRYGAVVVTKLDETTRIGNILSAFHEKKKQISFITDGQKVPQDIEPATVVRLLMNLDGFRINRQKLEKKFPSQRELNFEWR